MPRQILSHISQASVNQAALEKINRSQPKAIVIHQPQFVTESDFLTMQFLTIACMLGLLLTFCGNYVATQAARVTCQDLCDKGIFLQSCSCSDMEMSPPSSIEDDFIEHGPESRFLDGGTSTEGTEYGKAYGSSSYDNDAEENSLEVDKRSPQGHIFRWGKRDMPQQASYTSVFRWGKRDPQASSVFRWGKRAAQQYLLHEDGLRSRSQVADEYDQGQKRSPASSVFKWGKRADPSSFSAPKNVFRWGKRSSWQS